VRRGAAARAAMREYRAWSAPPPAGPRRVAVFYSTAYGNTRRMAEEVAAGARAAGAEAGLHDLESTPPGSFPALVEAADAIAVGSPTLNGDAVKPAWDLLSSLATVKLRGKAAAAFGSYAWSGEAVKMLEERMRSLKMRVAAEVVRAHFVPSGDDLAACRALGAALAAPPAPAAKAG
jgi:flavorubredoxin